MNRYVEPEWLDQLPAENPDAIASRRDLRVLNFCMGNASVVARAVASTRRENESRRVVELGAGDGHFMVQVARRLGTTWQGSRALLVDRQSAIDRETREGITTLGWELEVVQADIFDWLDSHGIAPNDIVIANLVAHHFDEARLTSLLRSVALVARAFIAVEPRRSLYSLGFSKLVGMIGCNRVTRHDAPASVRAGFRENEFSRLWPETTGWWLEERRAGSFSHLFVAKRNASPD
jgi:hypothetical protein